MIAQNSISTAFATISCCASYSNAVAVAEKRATIRGTISMAPMNNRNAAKIFSTITVGAFSVLCTVNTQGRGDKVNLNRQHGW